MAINFPTGPTVGQEYTAGVKKWTWNGLGWQSTSITYGPTGPTGPAGGVTKIIAGDNIIISPTGGTGEVTINSSGGGGGGLTTTTVTLSTNTATAVDTVAISSFTTIEYTVSIKQGSVVRSSKVFVQNNTTNVDYTEYAVMSTGGSLAGILVAAELSSTDMVLKVTITNASSSNATIKLQKSVI